MVWRLDRISRRQREGVNLLADWCEQGVRVVVIRDGWTSVAPWDVSWPVSSLA